MNLNIKYRQYQHMRSIACLSVVSQPMLAYFYHNLNLTPSLKVIWYALMAFVKFSAPVFIFFIGITTHTTQETYGERVRYVSKVDLRPFMIWNIIYLLLKVGKGHTILEYIKMFFLGDATPHLWYAVLMLQFQYLYPILLKITRPFLKNIRRSILFGLTILAGYFFLNMAGFYWFSESTSEWVRLIDRWLLTFLVYYIMGILFDSYYENIMPVLSRLFPFTVIAFIGIFILSMMQNDSLNNLHYFNPTMYVYNLIAIILLLSLCFVTARKINMIGNFLDYLSTMCFDVYLSNYMVFLVLRTLFASVQDTLHPLVILLFSYVLTVTLSILLVTGYKALWNRFKVQPVAREKNVMLTEK